MFVIAPIWWVPRSYVVSANPPELHEHGWQLVAGNFFFFATVVFLVGVAAMLFVRSRSSGSHVRELQDGLPVAGGGTRGESPLEDVVGELRPAVAVGAKQVDLASGDAQLLGPVTSGQLGETRGGRDRRRGRSRARVERFSVLSEERVAPQDQPEVFPGPQKDRDVES